MRHGETNRDCKGVTCFRLWPVQPQGPEDYIFHFCFVWFGPTSSVVGTTCRRDLSVALLSRIWVVLFCWNMFICVRGRVWVTRRLAVVCREIACVEFLSVVACVEFFLVWIHGITLTSVSLFLLLFVLRDVGIIPSQLFFCSFLRRFSLSLFPYVEK